MHTTTTIFNQFLLQCVLVSKAQVVIQLPLQPTIHIHHFLHAQAIRILNLVHAAAVMPARVAVVVEAAVAVAVAFHEGLVAVDVRVALLGGGLGHEVVGGAGGDWHGRVGLVV